MPLPSQGDAPLAARPARFEVAMLGGVFGGADLGRASADLLTNQVASGAPTSLFTTRSEMTTAPAVEGRVGAGLTRALWVEAGLSYARPDFSVEISGDVEGAPDVTATSRLTQLVADVGVQYRWRGRRISPFVMAGGGYLRQLDEPRTTAETGAMYYGGGGILLHVAPASRGFLRRLAVRADVRAAWLRGGVRLVDERGPSIVASGGLSIGL